MSPAADPILSAIARFHDARAVSRDLIAARRAAGNATRPEARLAAALDAEDVIAAEIVAMTPATPAGALALLGWIADGADDSQDAERLRALFDAVGRARSVLANPDSDLRRLALQIAASLPANGDDARAVLGLVADLLDWRDGTEGGAHDRA
jgi:hypothetical protein